MVYYDPHKMKIYQTLSVVGFMVTALVSTTLANSTTPSESNGETGCPESQTWKPDKQSCYLYLDDNTNSTQAIASCERLAAQLVSIGSEEENQLILDYVGTMNLPIWIGLFRTTTDICAGNSCGGWGWFDGSELRYTNWAADIAPTALQCVFMDSQGEWGHGRLCTGQRGFVCEQKRIFPSTTVEPTTTRSDLMNPTSYGIERDLVSITDATRPNNGGDNTPLIVGCVVGGLVFIGIITAGVILVKRHRNASKTDQPIRNKDRKSPKRDEPMKKKDRISPQKDQPKKDKDRKSTQKKHSKRCTNADDVNGTTNRGYSYQDVELGTRNKRGKQTPANSITGAHGGVGSIPEPVYAEPIKKKKRPGSEGVEVQENSLYASGK